MAHNTAGKLVMAVATATVPALPTGVMRRARPDKTPIAGSFGEKPFFDMVAVSQAFRS